MFICFVFSECVMKCTIDEKLNRIAACAYTCEMTHGFENPQFLELIQCYVNNDCLVKYPNDGICYGNDENGIKHLKSMDQIKGEWWVIRGVNCGQDDDNPGGYDGYPCQMERFIKEDNGQWVNKVTYCDGKQDQCISDIILTVANVSMPHSGVLQMDYTDAPLSPQVTLYLHLSSCAKNNQ